MKVLVTGANGQLGGEIVDAFAGWEVIPTGQVDLDITDKGLVEVFLSKKNPEWVIHCAAWTDVEGCAEDPAKAMRINSEATRNLAEATKKIGAKLVYISTNEVFDGKKQTPYVETDKTNPINPYAVSKLLGEKYVQEILGENGTIVRTSWVYGPKGKSNFPLKIIAAAEKFGKLSVVDDEIAVPTYAPDLARAVFELLQKDPSGIYHLVNEGFCSRYDWAVDVLKDSGRGNVKTEPIKLKDFPRKSTPPKYAVLENTRGKKISVQLPSWQQSLNKFLEVREDLLA